MGLIAGCEVLVFGLAGYFGGFASASIKVVVALGAGTVQLAVEQRFGFDKAVFAVAPVNQR